MCNQYTTNTNERHLFCVTSSPIRTSQAQQIASAGRISLHGSVFTSSDEAYISNSAQFVSNLIYRFVQTERTCTTSSCRIARSCIQGSITPSYLIYYSFTTVKASPTHILNRIQYSEWTKLMTLFSNPIKVRADGCRSSGWVAYEEGSSGGIYL